MKPTSVQSLLDAIRVDKVGEKVPKGWHSVTELATEAGVSACHMQRLLRAGIATGKIETKRFRVNSGDRVFPKPFYREKG